MLEVRLSSHARRSFEKLARGDQRIFSRIDRALDRIASNPDIGKQLVGPLSGLRSHRVGAYRIIYRIDQHEVFVFVLSIRHRGAVYRHPR